MTAIQKRASIRAKDFAESRFRLMTNLPLIFHLTKIVHQESYLGCQFQDKKSSYGKIKKNSDQIF